MMIILACYSQVGQVLSPPLVQPHGIIITATQFLILLMGQQQGAGARRNSTKEDISHPIRIVVSGGYAEGLRIPGERCWIGRGSERT